MKRWAIEREVIEAINESARYSLPNEFLCLLRAEKGVVTELVLLPGTISGESHGILDVNMAPISFGVVGSAHSHPGYSNHPSDADLGFFNSMGGIHIITCEPFDLRSWKAYDSSGRPLDVDLV